MLRFLFRSGQEESTQSSFTTPPSPREGSIACHIRRIGKGTFTERLDNIEYDRDKVPRLLQDAVHFTPMNNPCMVDFVRDHAIDVKTLADNNYINPATNLPVDSIPTSLDSLYREIKSIESRRDVISLKELRKKRARMILLRDAIKYCLDHNKELHENKKTKLESELQEAEKQVTELNIQIPAAEKPLKAALSRLLRLEGQVELLLQRDKFISVLEEIYCLQQQIREAVEKNPVDSKFIPGEDVFAECYRLFLSPLSAESEKCHCIISLKSKLLAKAEEFFKLTDEIINSENKDEDVREHDKIIAAKNEEKNLILQPYDALIKNECAKKDEWQAREARILQLIDRKQECIRQLQYQLAMEADLKPSLYKAASDHEYILSESGYSAEAVAESVGSKLLSILKSALDPAGLDNDKAVTDFIKTELHVWNDELATQLLAISRKKTYFRLLDNIKMLEQELEQEMTASFDGLKKNLCDSDLESEEIDHILQDQRDDIYKSDPVISKKFALATELEACLKLSETIGITDHQQSLRQKLNDIYSGLQFLVPPEDDSARQEKKESAGNQSAASARDAHASSILNYCFRANHGMSGSIHRNPSAHHPGLFYLRSMPQRQHEPARLTQHIPDAVEKQAASTHKL